MKNNMYAEALENEMDSLQLHYGKHDLPDGTVIFSIGLPGKKLAHTMFAYLVHPNGQATVQNFAARGVQPFQRIPMLECLNDINCEQKYLKLSLTKTNDVNVESEIIVPTQLDEVYMGEYLFTMLLLASEALDQYMPRILGILWSEYDDEKDENATGDVDMTLLEAIMEDWQRTLEEREAEEAVDNGACADPVL